VKATNIEFCSERHWSALELAERQMAANMEMRKMRKHYIALLIPVVGCILFLQFGCQEHIKPEKAETLVQSDKGGPKITFENIINDFGQIGVTSGKKVAEFKFTNTGDGLLKITEVEKCCEVTTVLDKTEFAPGESGVFKAEFQSNQKPGLMSRILYIRSNDTTKPRIALTIKAIVVSKVSHAPKNLKLFLEEENAGCPKIVLSSIDNQSFSIWRFTSTGDSITADVDGSVEATKFVLSPKVDMEKLNENPKGRIYISLTHPEERAVEILFDMVPKFSISPSSIFIVNAVPQKPIARKVSVVNNYGGAFEIESFSSQNNTVKILEQETISTGYQLDVEITPPPSEGKTIFTEALMIKIKGGDELVVICQGFYSERG
jgi:hypothetical protein